MGMFANKPTKAYMHALNFLILLAAENGKKAYALFILHLRKGKEHIPNPVKRKYILFLWV